MAAEARQSFLRVISLCWSRPRLLAIELAWRWFAGGFLLLLAVLAALRIADATAAQIRATGLFNATIESAVQDPTQLSAALSGALTLLTPWVEHEALGLAPLSVFVWLGAFAIGRTALLRRYDPSLPGRAWLLAGCEGLRLSALLAFSALWYEAVEWTARYALGPAKPEAGVAQAEPNLVLYCALALGFTVGLYMLWALLSWVLVAAPLIALLERTSLMGGFVGSWRRRRVRRELLEVNVAMAIIKLGLIVLAMVFSATPLPFASSMQGWPLNAWLVLVTLLYCAASDFFKMARWFAFLEQLRPARPFTKETAGPSLRL